MFTCFLLTGIFTDFFLLIIITMIKTAIRSVNSNRRSTPLTPLATTKLLLAELSEWLKDEATVVDTNLSVGLSVVVSESVCIQSKHGCFSKAIEIKNIRLNTVKGL